MSGGAIDAVGAVQVGSTDDGVADAATVPVEQEALPLHTETAVDPLMLAEHGPAITTSVSGRPRWRSRYQRGVVAVDALAATSGVVLALLNRFNHDENATRGAYPAFAIAIPLVWLFCASLNRAYEARFLGAGTTEFVRVGRAFLQLTAIISFIAYATKSDISRSVSLTALFLTLTFSVTGRLILRGMLLHRRRRAGRAIVPVLAVGSAGDIARFNATLERNRSAGFAFVGACVPAEDDIAPLTQLNIPVYATTDSIKQAVATSGAQTVAVVSSALTGERLRWIAWQLEGTDTDLVVLPGLSEVAGRRLDLQQVGGLPLLYVAQPEFKGIQRVLKSGFDRVGAGLLLLISAPTLLAVALAVRLSSDGPALYRQTRVGKDGKTFHMLKFRSMQVGADAMVSALQESNDVAGGILFKIKNDPRVTPVGRFLRRFSLDELPQLFNVLAGSMSLVGPRPPLPSEVAKYGYDAQRRLLVKPGLTGLWQVSGRSDLSWEESVLLDLRYVENWSLALDMIVLVKTASAVVRSRGAY